MKKKRFYLTADDSGELHLLVGTVPPVKLNGGRFAGLTESTEYCGQVYPENIDGPLPAAGHYVNARLIIVKGK